MDAVCSAAGVYFSLFNISEPFLYAESINYQSKMFIRDIGLSYSEILQEHEAAIVLDFNEIEKYNLNPETTLIIDHHQPLQSHTEDAIIIPEALSTCQLVYNYLKANNARFYPESYKALALGILADTACFKSLDKETLRIFLELLERVDYSELLPYIDAKPIDKKLSILKSIHNIELFSSQKYVIAFLKIGAHEGAAASFITELADICFTVSEDKEFSRISARSSPSFSKKTNLHLYRDILAHLEGNGNGHKQAAGMQTKASYLQIKSNLLTILEKTLGPIQKH